MHVLSTAVVGASGYSGLELTRILARHPRLRLNALLSDRWAGERAGDRLPLPEPFAGLRYGALGDAATVDAEVAFLATPAEVSHELAPRLLARGVRVVDLSGAFRLADPALYPPWYGFEHRAPELLAEARYGLPELAREQLAGARLVTNPGCYATAIALALAPLLRSGLVDADSVTVAAMSGVSGAGRKAERGLRVLRGRRGSARLPDWEAPARPGDRADGGALRRSVRAALVHAAPRPPPARHPRHLHAPPRPRRRPCRARGRLRAVCERALPARPPGRQGFGEGRRPDEPGAPRRRRRRARRRGGGHLRHRQPGEGRGRTGRAGLERRHELGRGARPRSPGG